MNALTEQRTAAAGVRIACVQHGDYGQAIKSLTQGSGETYHAQAYSVMAMERLCEGHSRMILSLDAPRSLEADRQGVMIGVGPQAWWVRPRRVAAKLRARRVVALLRHYRPTHVLIRSMEEAGIAALKWAIRSGLPCAVVVAGRFDLACADARRFASLCNHPLVALVGNHNRVATRSMIHCGLDSNKAVAWDWPPVGCPDEAPVRSLPRRQVARLLFVGSLIEEKGVRDVVSAAACVRGHGHRIHLQIIGDGPLRSWVGSHAGVAEGWLTVSGRLPLHAVAQAIGQSQLVVVPSRPAFPEGLPMIIYEALAQRTPLVLSDHPVFCDYFTEGEAVAFFRSGDSMALAETVAALLRNEVRYRALSAHTLSAWRAIQCDMRFADVFDRIAQAWFR